MRLYGVRDCSIVRAMKPRTPSYGDALELRVTIREISPEIWRTIRVPADLTLGQLHHVLQIACGWMDSHLHDFQVGTVRFGMDGVDEAGGMFSVSEDAALLGAVASAGSRFVYRYDFGDNWVHDVKVDRIVEDAEEDGIVCLDGRRAGPPEDCGSTHGYARMLAILADPADPEYKEMRTWVGRRYDPEKFNRTVVNKKLAALAKRLGRGRGAGSKPATGRAR